MIIRQIDFEDKENFMLHPGLKDLLQDLRRQQADRSLGSPEDFPAPCETMRVMGWDYSVIRAVEVVVAVVSPHINE